MQRQISCIIVENKGDHVFQTLTHEDQDKAWSWLQQTKHGPGSSRPGSRKEAQRRRGKRSWRQQRAKLNYTTWKPSRPKLIKRLWKPHQMRHSPVLFNCQFFVLWKRASGNTQSWEIVGKSGFQSRLICIGHVLDCEVTAGSACHGLQVASYQGHGVRNYLGLMAYVMKQCVWHVLPVVRVPAGGSLSNSSTYHLLSILSTGKLQNLVGGLLFGIFWPSDCKLQQDGNKAQTQDRWRS